ncbi:hypothetical protein M2347_001274 [Chryseobacterium sp. H1D6B]|uniref:hypothetical protein n=1 Tax=Chryseobacterium sp. H1D6B TaxID=2940588 RepID=UPI0015C72DFB|nr:hypothetical protein [Chryseobacterium sp. H1D6B]MDH6251547.1 hypothetical protein [Chryseobacterium sp. H1D6B]
MKNVLFTTFIFSLLFTACSKKESINSEAVQDIKPHYDTVAVDSFSNGAVSVDIARQIRMSSKQYKDSVKEVLRVQTEEKRIKQELEKENKKKVEEEKKKAGPDKKEKTEQSQPSNGTKAE